MDWNNFAPSIGAAWSPTASGGFLRRLTGDGAMVVRGGYAMSYSRNGLGTFTGAIGDNPGVSLNVFRSVALGNLGGLPLLLRDSSRLGPGAFPQTFVEPYTDVVTGDMTVFSPDLRVPTAQTWQVGVQRALGQRMAFEVRYVGSRSDGNWRDNNNYNELNIIENGFLDEFKLAQANLQANVAAGRGGTFAYMGPGTGTSPLPIFLAYFNGVGRDRAGDAALYSSAKFPERHLPESARAFQSQSVCGGRCARCRRGVADTRIDCRFAAELHRRQSGPARRRQRRGEHAPTRGTTRWPSSSGGVRSPASISRPAMCSATRSQTRFLTLRRDNPLVRNGGDEGDVTHAAKINLVYELPFGQGKPFGSNVNGFVDRIIGGWQVGVNARVQSGQLVDLGNVRLVGMDADELSQMYKVRIDSERRVWMLPEAIINESVKAFSVDPASPTGYSTLGPPSGKYIAPADSLDCIETVRGWGDCGLRSVVLTGPIIQAVRPRHLQARAGVEPGKRGIPHRRAECVEPHQLRSGQRDGRRHRGGQYRQPGERRQPRQLRRHDAGHRQSGPHRPAHGAFALVVSRSLKLTVDG